MSYRVYWKFTNIPEKIVDIIDTELMNSYGRGMDNSRLMGDNINKSIRNSKNVWVPHEHWSAGFVWHYVNMINRENFLYDIDCIDGGNMQYTQYEKGEYYDWHYDETIEGSVYVGSNSSRAGQERINMELELMGEKVRKLSFVLQLSDPDDYEGGNLILVSDDGTETVAPRIKGTFTVFDSRTRHKACEVTKGTRRSLVGWITGPRWR